MSNDLIPKLPVGCKKFTLDELERQTVVRLVASIPLYGDDDLNTVDDWIFRFRKIQDDHRANRQPGENDILLAEPDGESYDGPDRIDIRTQRDESDDEYVKRLTGIAEKKKAYLKRKRRKAKRIANAV
jgi:hypothetical protein